MWRPQNRFHDIKKKIIKRIYGDKPTESSRYVVKILKLYLKYAMQALAHGYPINIRRVGKIQLIKTKPVIFKEFDEFKYFQSDKHYGHMFYINFYLFEKKDNVENSFYPCEDFAKLLNESIQSDNIYELIK